MAEQTQVDFNESDLNKQFSTESFENQTSNVYIHAPEDDILWLSQIYSNSIRALSLKGTATSQLFSKPTLSNSMLLQSTTEKQTVFVGVSVCDLEMVDLGIELCKMKLNQNAQGLDFDINFDVFNRGVFFVGKVNF